MNHLKKVTNYMWVILMVAIMIAFCFCFSAQLSAEENIMPDNENDISAARSISGNVNCSLGGGEGMVWVDVRRSFSLFSSPIQIYVYLYSSEVYCENVEDMNLREWKYEGEFRSNDSIKLELRTYGQQLYWRTVIKICKKSNAWEKIFDTTLLRNGEGNVIN
ncbi:MAG: hypothetical protein HFK07_06130 [Clostridia bacterium]|jgi:hypothetical protein|nr:hypothetical protein [Clostridia bacterium]MCX4367780.1 hypothetical protein [Clostridia bacterium]